MATDPTTQRGGYDLPLSSDAIADSAERIRSASRDVSLSRPVLLENAFWFCRIRWLVVAVFLVFGMVSQFPAIVGPLGLQSRIVWPFVLAGIAAAMNVGFLLHARHLADAEPGGSVKVALWTQIVFDLVAVTLFVHYAGSLESNVAFIYLFHIVLACIFFSRRESFVVVAIACSLFVTCVAFEAGGLITPGSVYASKELHLRFSGGSSLLFMGLTSVIVVLVVVWYLASRLSTMVRERDNELVETNRRLVAAQEEKMRHMLRTTHELKAPFAAIQANSQLLLRGYCGELPGEAVDVVTRISERCRRLAREIKEMLQLANLRSTDNEPPPMMALDLAKLLEECTQLTEQVAGENGVVIESDFEPAAGWGVADRVKMLFLNLLSNAVLYSRKGGRVSVRCSSAPGAGGGAVVTVEDEGIGIPAQKLPRIFDEYYRTNEAAQHNKESTGLGLAIVRSVAESHGVRVRVESAEGAGTKFTLRFPAGEPEGGGDSREKGEVSNGVPADSRR